MVGPLCNSLTLLVGALTEVALGEPLPGKSTAADPTADHLQDRSQGCSLFSSASSSARSPRSAEVVPRRAHIYYTGNPSSPCAVFPSATPDSERPPWRGPRLRVRSGWAAQWPC